MYGDRICPICGDLIEQRNTEEAASSAYGRRISLSLSCANPLCGFELAFPFTSEVYVSYVCEEIRKRTRTLPADARAEALLASLSYCERGGEDALSLALTERVNVIFMEALGEILKDSREMLRALSHREPNAEKRRASREALRIFLSFLELMEGRYPTKRLEGEFLAIEEALGAIDRHYELGMLALESDFGAAEEHFTIGAREGGIRSRVAYVKYVLTEKAESEEDHHSLKNAFADLAPYTQEACHEYVRRAEVGVDGILEVLTSYEEATYGTLSHAGKIAFLRLELSACVEVYEPTLAALMVVPVRNDGDGRVQRILDELAELIQRLTRQCEGLFRSINEKREDSDYAGDTVAEHAACVEIDTLIEYLIGCAMYYRSMLDIGKRFDVPYLLTAIGHFSCFLLSPLMTESVSGELELPSLIGFRGLTAIRENAVHYRHALRESAGIGEGEDDL